LVEYIEHTRHPCDKPISIYLETKRNGENGHVLQDSLLLLQLEVILPVDVGETPLARNDDLLASRELITGTTESFLYDWCVVVLAPDGEDDLTNVHSCDGAIWFSPSATHTSLQSIRDVSIVYIYKKAMIKNSPIGTGTAQQLVDPQNVERMNPDPQMERILSGRLRHVFISANTGGF
jgi:hypothetical protein